MNGSDDFIGHRTFGYSSSTNSTNESFSRLSPLRRGYIRSFLYVCSQIPLYGVHRYDLLDADGNLIWLGISSYGVTVYDKNYDTVLTTFTLRRILEITYRNH